MGRSVSTPVHAIQVVYFDVSHIGMVQEVDDDGKLMWDGDEPVLVYDDMIGQDEWDEFVQYRVVEPSMKHYKSLYEVSNKWLGREDRVLLANDHAYIGISLYMDVAAVWVVSRYDYDDDSYQNHYREAPLAQHWCESIKIEKVLKPNLNRVGNFSNGVSIYRRIT